MIAGEVYTVRVHRAPSEELWAEVVELPGCFAAGDGMQGLREALTEAISLYLSEPGEVKQVELANEPGSVTEYRVVHERLDCLARTGCSTSSGSGISAV